MSAFELVIVIVDLAICITNANLPMKRENTNVANYAQDILVVNLQKVCYLENSPQVYASVLNT